jgi:hypothetical protein
LTWLDAGKSKEEISDYQWKAGSSVNKRPHLTMRWGQKVKIRKEERCPISFPTKYYANYEPTSSIA